MATDDQPFRLLLWSDGKLYRWVLATNRPELDRLLETVGPSPADLGLRGTDGYVKGLWVLEGMMRWSHEPYEDEPSMCLMVDVVRRADESELVGFGGGGNPWLLQHLATPPSAFVAQNEQDNPN